MMMRISKKQGGMSLVELMVAITLSLILTLGIIQIFSSSKQTGRVQEALARLQENARFTLDILSRDLRMAGQLGCNSNADVRNSSDGQLDNSALGGLFGYEWSDTLAVALTGSNATPDAGTVVDNTDVIVVMAAGTGSVPATSNGTTIDAVVDDLAVGDPAIISDCESADVFVVDAVDTTNGTTTAIQALSKDYAAGAELAPLHYTAYYLRVDDGERHLYRTYVNGISASAGISSDPLLSGIEDLQILYGETQNDGTIRYVAADAAGLDMERVTSLRLHLLLATEEDNLATTPQTYWFYDPDTNAVAEHTATDRRLYRSFTTTIQLRNQGLGT